MAHLRDPWCLQLLPAQLSAVCAVQQSGLGREQHALFCCYTTVTPCTKKPNPKEALYGDEKCSVRLIIMTKTLLIQSSVLWVHFFLYVGYGKMNGLIFVIVKGVETGITSPDPEQSAISEQFLHYL